MRAILSASIFCTLVSANVPSLAQTLPAPPPPLSDSYKGADAVFTNWSGVDIYPGPSADQPRYSVRYTICNLDPKNGLLFLWAKPAVLTGFKNPLPPGKCMDSIRDSTNFVADYNAPILFTQSNQSKQASTYLPISNGNGDMTSRAQGWFSSGEQGSIIDFTIHTSVNSDGNTSYSITWAHGTPIIGVSMNVSRDVLQGIAQDLSKLTGVRITTNYADEIITKDDYSRLGKDAREALYLEFSPSEQEPKRFEFKVDTARTHNASGAILFIDSNHELIYSAPYESS
jgi:hypothetical protein